MKPYVTLPHTPERRTEDESDVHNRSMFEQGTLSRSQTSTSNHSEVDAFDDSVPLLPPPMPTLDEL